LKVGVKFIDRWNVWRNLRGYPIYAAPFASSNPLLSREQMDANYRRFLEQKPARLQYLAGYLATFSLPLRLASPQGCRIWRTACRAH
jgi:hypothetical protein